MSTYRALNKFAAEHRELVDVPRTRFTRLVFCRAGRRGRYHSGRARQQNRVIVRLCFDLDTRVPSPSFPRDGLQATAGVYPTPPDGVPHTNHGSGNADASTVTLSADQALLGYNTCSLAYYAELFQAACIKEPSEPCFNA